MKTPGALAPARGGQAGIKLPSTISAPELSAPLAPSAAPAKEPRASAKRRMCRRACSNETNVWPVVAFCTLSLLSTSAAATARVVSSRAADSRAV